MNKPPTETPEKYDIRFEKRYMDGGIVSLFGNGLVPSTRRKKEYVWWYFNPITHHIEKVPEGFTPRLDPQYYEDDPFFGNSPYVTNSDDIEG